MYGNNLERLLGVDKHSEFLNRWCLKSEMFRQHLYKGFIGYPGESFNERMRQCLVGLAKDAIGVYDIRVKVALAAVGPDVECLEITPPWKVVGAAEGIRHAVESYLLSEVDAEKASKQIAQTLRATPWRKEHK